MRRHELNVVIFFTALLVLSIAAGIGEFLAR